MNDVLAEKIDELNEAIEVAYEKGQVELAAELEDELLELQEQYAETN